MPRSYGWFRTTQNSGVVTARTSCLASAIFQVAVFTVCLSFANTTLARSPAHVTAHPASLDQLFGNLKLGLERGLLLPEEFYTDSSLMAFYGADAIHWILNSREDKSARAQLSDALRRNCLSGGGVRWVVPKATGKRFGSFSAVAICRIRVEQITAVFGRATSTELFKGYGGHDPLPPAADDPMGNRILTFVVRAPDRVMSYVKASFDPHGNLRSIDFVQREI
jgi:hypothetical protein